MDESTPDRAIVAALLRLSAIPKENWHDCIQQVLQVVSEVLNVDRVSYWSLRRDPTLLRCEMGYIAGPRAFERGLELLEADHPAYFEAVFNSPVIEIEDVHGDPRTADMTEYLSVRDISSLLDVPVWSRGKVVGLLCHEQTGASRNWNVADLEFATAVAQTVAAAIEAHARGKAEQCRRAAEFLDRVSRHLTAARDVHEAARHALECAIPNIAAWGVLDLCGGGDELERIGQVHRTAQGSALLAELGRRFPPRLHAPHLTVQSIELRQSVLIPDLDRVPLTDLGFDPEFERIVRALKSRSAMAAPLFAGDRVLGAVALVSVDRTYTQADLGLCEEFALRIALALENARLHAEAREAIRARDEFIALAAHELHGPLGSLQLAAESLASRVASSSAEAITRMSDTIVRQTQRLNRLVDHMLDAARVISHNLALSVERLDLGALVREIAQGFAERAEQAGSPLQLRIEEPLVGLWDGDRLAQVVTNLLDNAIKFGDGKPIEVSLKAEDGAAELVVRDHGIGIPRERLAVIFQRFQRAVSPRRYGGLGLGLFTAKAVVEAHDGTIAIESEPGRGTTVRVRLPLELRSDGAGKCPP